MQVKVAISFVTLLYTPFFFSSDPRPDAFPQNIHFLLLPA
jgi:hypothetical protein